MARPLGKHQLRLLLQLGSPGMRLVVGDRLSRSLERRGLLRATGGPVKTDDGRDLPPGLFQITPAGLRALADALERGQLEQFFKKHHKEETQS